MNNFLKSYSVFDESRMNNEIWLSIFEGDFNIFRYIYRQLSALSGRCLCDVLLNEIQ